jgi:hypothetical protein
MERKTHTQSDVFDDLKQELEYYLVNPSRGVLVTLATSSLDKVLPTIRVLAQPGTLTWLKQNFPIATRIQTLIKQDTVVLREADLQNQTTTLVSSDGITALVQVETATTSFDCSAGSATKELLSECEVLWSDAEPYTLYVPSRTEMLQSAEEVFGETFRERLERSLDVAESFEDPTKLHEVRAAVVVGAAEEQLHYEVRRWGEDTGVASSASFSRHKTALQEAGVIETEKRSVPMGRPRQRLLLTKKSQEVLEGAGFDALIADVATAE